MTNHKQNTIGVPTLGSYQNELLPPTHFGQHLANQTLDWLPTDTKENYLKLLQDTGHQQYFAKLGWDQPGAITYKFNQHGFRADEFDSKPCMVALGCSYTVGIGLPDHVTWARQTATALNLKCANLGWGGYSTDTCYRMAEYWIPQLMPAYVCMLAPPRARLELLLATKSPHEWAVEIFLANSQSKFFNASDIYLKHWFLNEENAKINQRKNILAIRQLCADLAIACTVFDADEHMWWNREEIGYARDFMHAGPKIHTALAKKFAEAYAR